VGILSGRASPLASSADGLILPQPSKWPHTPPRKRIRVVSDVCPAPLDKVLGIHFSPRLNRVWGKNFGNMQEGETFFSFPQTGFPLGSPPKGKKAPLGAPGKKPGQTTGLALKNLKSPVSHHFGIFAPGLDTVCGPATRFSPLPFLKKG
ncbi:hypothetical protein TNIN_239071, partial [Trichonephila inaurata madagascariensis]